MTLEHTDSNGQMQPHMKQFSKLMYWAAYETWNPRILAGDSREEEPRAHWAENFLRSYSQLRREGTWDLHRTLYCPSSILPGDAGSTQVMSLGIHSHDTLENLRWSNPRWGDATMNLCLHVSTRDWLLSTAHFTFHRILSSPLSKLSLDLTYYNKIIKTKHLLLSLTCNWIKIHIQVI